MSQEVAESIPGQGMWPACRLDPSSGLLIDVFISLGLSLSLSLFYFFFCPHLLACTVFPVPPFLSLK